MRWDDAVRKGRILVAQESGCRWELGDLALEVAPLRSHGGKRDRDADDRVDTQLNRFADTIGASYAALDSYRHVAARWPKATRVNLSWSMHRALAKLEDREAIIARAITEGWNVRDAEEHVRALRPEKEGAVAPAGWDGSEAITLCASCLHSVELEWGAP
jgi:hypothetical protein